MGLLGAFFIFHPVEGKIYEGFWNGFVLGGIHGGLAPYNWILSFFLDGHSSMAAEHSTVYLICWWFGLVINLLIFVLSFLLIVALPSTKSASDESSMKGSLSEGSSGE